MKVFDVFFTYLLFSGMFIVTSCNDELVLEKRSCNKGSELKLSNTEIKKEFGAALAKVLNESFDARKLIRDEALKKIDHDYDVLYLLVKDENLSGNTTLEKCMLKYVDADLLKLVEIQIPNLTIFVPHLPENSFSAEIWDVERDIPCVGIRTVETNDITAFNSKGENYLIESQLIPAYPIVVVKENERVISKNKYTKAIEKNVITTKANSNITFEFLDATFDNLNPQTLKGDRFPESFLFTDEQFAKTKEAYELYKNKDGWQRDYIYYDISHETPDGPFKYNISEYIVGFQMVGSPLSAYNKISDQTSDPQLDSHNRENSGWSDGEFEFKLKLYLGSRTAVGDVLEKYLRIKPSDLFNFGTKSSGGSGYYYILDGITLNESKVNTLLPLFEWNLENYSPSIKIGIEEVDGTETIVDTNTTSTEFAGNFSFDLGFGQTVKKGMKFGVSNKHVNTTTYQVSTTKGNDILGEFIVNFGDPVVVNIYEKRFPPTPTHRNGYTAIERELNSKYETGWCKVFLAPLKNN